MHPHVLDDAAVAVPALAGDQPDAGPGLNSLTGWLVGFAMVLLLAAVAWWASRSGRR
ncbi:MAG TPA: hypothetical protein VK964_00580 [Nocardioidaceae bacterium]|nr:hypothetical protein [Nocardioidaceae bacterium]